MSHPAGESPDFNVIVFGESGAGKSSVINMLHGDLLAEVSDGATGVTFENQSYMKDIGGRCFRVFDTVGLNEGSHGTVKPQDAVEKLWKLINKLGDGVHLLVLVMRGPRVTQTFERNYKLFFEIFCQRKVPIAIIITGLEGRADMDSWWVANKKSFDKHFMKFCDHACITSTKGALIHGEHCYQQRYDKSKLKVEHLIVNSCGQPWKLDPIPWFLTIIDKIIGVFETKEKNRHKRLTWALHKCAGMPSRQAKQEAKAMEARRNGGRADLNAKATYVDGGDMQDDRAQAGIIIRSAGIADLIDVVYNIHRL
jgi:hypothetical protein